MRLELNTATEKIYRRFLLGIASEEEESRAEEAILGGEVDASFLDDVEDEIIDDYVLGTIAREEKDGFTAHFLTVEDRRQRLAFATALVEYARKQPAEQPSKERTFSPRPSLATALFWKRTALFAMAASVLLAALAGNEYIKLRRQIQIASEAHNEVTGVLGALANRIGEPSQAHAQSPEALIITPRAVPEGTPVIEIADSSRGVLPPSVRIPAQAEFIRIDLKLSPPLADRYREVVLTSSGEELWGQEFSGSILPSDGQSTLVLPVSVLAPGLYHVQVKSASAEGRFVLSEDHVFRVVKD